MINENKNLKEEILKTMIWFDLFSHPLTTYEIFKYLNLPSSLSEIIKALNELADKIKNKNGFYYLNNRENIVDERFKRLNYFNNKVKKAKRFVNLISRLPFVRGVAVSNIIGDHNLKKGSDIDLFIISSKNRIWLTRFFCVFIAKILHLRPNKKTKENKICLSFYISEDNLNLNKYLLNPRDLYFVYWIANLQIIFSRNNVWQKFWSANIWLKKYLPNFSFPLLFSKTEDNNKLEIESNISIDELIDDKFLSPGRPSFWLENIFKKIQLKLMPTELKNQSHLVNPRASGVILSNNIIKLFLEDKRSFFIEQYEENIRKIN